MSRIGARIRQHRRDRREIREQRRHAGYYNGSEDPDTRPPGRYARGERAVPAPPPTAF